MRGMEEDAVEMRGALKELAEQLAKARYVVAQSLLESTVLHISILISFRQELDRQSRMVSSRDRDLESLREEKEAEVRLAQHQRRQEGEQGRQQMDRLKQENVALKEQVSYKLICFWQYTKQLFSFIDFGSARVPLQQSLRRSQGPGGQAEGGVVGEGEEEQSHGQGRGGAQEGIDGGGGQSASHQSRQENKR